jgi:hypothetical protein
MSAPKPFSGPEWDIPPEASQYYAQIQLSDAKLALKHKVMTEVLPKLARRQQLIHREGDG